MRVVVALSVSVWVQVAVASPFTVVIDPGHGGAHDGARSPRGVREKAVTLAVSKKLAELAAAEGWRVSLTRTGDEDPPLDVRAGVANREKADLFLSIHCNSMPTAAARRISRGVETYSLSANATDAAAHALAARENADVGVAAGPVGLDPVSLILDDLARTQAHGDSSRLARIVQREFVRTARVKDRGVRQAPFLVLAGAEMPAVLVEIGFISHPVEGRDLAKPQYQDLVATALRDGIRAFRDQIHSRRTAPEPPAAPAENANRTDAPPTPPTAPAAPAVVPAMAPPAPVAPVTPATAAAKQPPNP